MDSNKNIVDQRCDIVAKLVAARIEKGITQSELAKMIGTQRSNICRLESGAQNLTVDMLLKISTALGKNIDFELTDKEEPVMQTYILKLDELAELEAKLEAKMERWMYLNELKEKIDAQK